MIANHPIKGHNYSYHIRGDRSPLSLVSSSFCRRLQYGDVVLGCSGYFE